MITQWRSIANNQPTSVNKRCKPFPCMWLTNFNNHGLSARRYANLTHRWRWQVQLEISLLCTGLATNKVTLSKVGHRNIQLPIISTRSYAANGKKRPKSLASTSQEMYRTDVPLQTPQWKVKFVVGHEIELLFLLSNPNRWDDDKNVALAYAIANDSEATLPVVFFFVGVNGGWTFFNLFIKIILLYYYYYINST